MNRSVRVSCDKCNGGGYTDHKIPDTITLPVSHRGVSIVEGDLIGSLEEDFQAGADFAAYAASCLTGTFWDGMVDFIDRYRGGR